MMKTPRFLDSWIARKLLLYVLIAVVMLPWVLAPTSSESDRVQAEPAQPGAAIQARSGASGMPTPQPASAHFGALSESQERVPARAGSPHRPDPVANLSIVSELGIDRWLRPGEYAWNDDGVPEGETVIVVNIRARVLSVYRGGIEIGRSSIIYGADNQPTPTGTFTILEKDADHVSNIYVGAPMPHMLRLTWDGIAIHGSENVLDDWATRGCVGLPLEFAELLFGVAGMGDRVIVWSGTEGVQA